MNKDLEKFTTENLTWNSRYFGMYTFFMTFTGFFLGVSGWWTLVSLPMFIFSLYAYAKNKEVIEIERQINNYIENGNKES